MTEPRTAAGRALLDKLPFRWPLADVLAIEDEAAVLDVERLQRALDDLNSGACGDPECCGGPDPWPNADDLAAAYLRS